MNILIFRRRKVRLADGTSHSYHRVQVNSYNLGSATKRQDGGYDSSFGGLAFSTLRRAQRHILANYKRNHGMAFASLVGRVRG